MFPYNSLTRLVNGVVTEVLCVCVCVCVCVCDRCVHLGTALFQLWIVSNKLILLAGVAVHMACKYHTKK
jgi:hypothetical protein